MTTERTFWWEIFEEFTQRTRFDFGGQEIALVEE